MPDPIAPVRDIGTVEDIHGYVIRVGVDHDAVTIGGAAYAMLGPEARDDFARHYFAADEEAKAWARANADDEDEDDAEREEHAAFMAEAAELDQLEKQMRQDEDIRREQRGTR